jgi:hypothetical protein
MKKYQDGFSIVEGLLIVVMVAMLGGVGWYVWHANGQANKNLDSAVNSANNSADATKKAQENKKANIYAGWKTYCDPMKVGCIKYPSDWTIVKELDKGAQKPNVRIISPTNSKHSTSVTFELIVSGPSFTTDDIDVDYTYDLTVPVKNLKVYEGVIKDTHAPIVSIIDPQKNGDPDKGGLSWSLTAEPNDLPYDTQEKTNAWYDSTEAVISREIVQSFTFQNK